MRQNNNMDTEQTTITTKQKAIGIMLMLIAVILAFYYVYSKTTLFPFGRGLQNAIQESSFTVDAGVEKPLLSAVLFCDVSLPECFGPRDTLMAFQNELPNDLSITYALYYTNENGRKAAIATLVAAQYIPQVTYQNALYANLSEWYELEDPTEHFIFYAESVGVEREAFSTALRDGLQEGSAYDKQVKESNQRAEGIGVTTVPTVFINNKIIAEPLTYNLLHSYLQEAYPTTTFTPSGSNTSDIEYMDEDARAVSENDYEEVILE